MRIGRIRPEEKPESCAVCEASAIIYVDLGSKHPKRWFCIKCGRELGQQTLGLIAEVEAKK